MQFRALSFLPQLRDHKLQMHPQSLLLSLLLCSLSLSHASAPESRFFKSAPSSPSASTKYFEVARPLPTDYQTTAYSLTLLEYDFNHTVGSPPVSVDYSPPSNASSEWTAVVVEFSASCSGKQYYRIAAVWIDGVEILRTSTPEPTEHGVFWKVRKDVTRYASVFQQSNATVSVMLENEVNDVFTGIYHVNLSLHFYEGQEIGVSSLEAMEKGEEENRFKMSRKLGFLAEDNTEGDRMVGWSLGEESRELGFLGEESVNWDDDDDDEDDDEMISKKVRGKEMGKEKIGFLSEETSSLMDRDEKLKSGFSHEQHSPLKTLRLPSEDLGMMDKGLKSKLLYGKPADLIIPISDNGDNGYWYRIQNESDTHSTEVQIPVNTYRAVLEIYVSSHSNDESWYSNPTNTFTQQNNLTRGQRNGTFREVFMTVDGLYVGSFVPFPVVYTVGVSPLFWEPVVAIGAFDLPSYDLDITPFLGHLLDGKLHSYRIGVTNAVSFWLVDANLHLWLDPGSPQVKANLVKYRAPEVSISRTSKFRGSEGEFKIKAKREFHFAGWVNSSFGNHITHVICDLKFKNELNTDNNGKFKDVEQRIKSKIEIRVEANPEKVLVKEIYKIKYPLHIKTTTEPKENNTCLLTTKFIHEMREKNSVSLPHVEFSSHLDNAQESNGWMRVQNHSVLSGVGSTLQKYKYEDSKGCYSRTVASNEGELMEDNFSDDCE